MGSMTTQPCQAQLASPLVCARQLPTRGRLACQAPKLDMPTKFPFLSMIDNTRVANNLSNHSHSSMDRG